MWTLLRSLFVLVLAMVVYFGHRNKMLCYHRETTLQSVLILAKSGKLELGDNILWTL